MMNIRKRLSIDIDEENTNEEEILINQIKKEVSNLNLGSSLQTLMSKSEEERNKLLEVDNNIINQVVNFMESENTGMDLSNHW
jgi:hypothetical protein